MKRAAFILILFAAPAVAADGDVPARSLFFPAGSAVSGGASAPVLNTGSNIRNFIYVGPEQWSFWWRGKLITNADLGGLTVESVGAAEVIFTETTPEGPKKWQFEVGKFDSGTELR